jgi:hypothetical protein
VSTYTSPAHAAPRSPWSPRLTPEQHRLVTFAPTGLLRRGYHPANIDHPLSYLTERLEDLTAVIELQRHENDRLKAACGRGMSSADRARSSPVTPPPARFKSIHIYGSQSRSGE